MITAPGLNFSQNSTSTDSSFTRFSPQCSFPSMSSVQRDMSSWGHSDHFTNDSFGNYSQHGNFSGALYTDFTQDWPDPHGTRSYINRNPPNSNPYRWQHEQYNWQDPPRNWFEEVPRGGHGNGNFRGRQKRGNFNHHGWNSWGPDNQGWQKEDPSWRPQSAGSGSQTKPSGSQNRWGQEPNVSLSKQGMQNNQWQNLTKQFGSSHFHREEANSRERRLSDGSSVAQADSSSLEDLGSSGGGKKRPRSFDRGAHLSKSSRAEKSKSGSYDFLRPNSNRTLIQIGIHRPGIQKSDSTSKQSKTHKGQMMTAKGIRSLTGTKAGGLGNKKKQTVLKHKAQSSASNSKTTVGSAKESETTIGSAKEPDEGNPGEGILERAERMCKELREKRKQALPSRASLNAQRVGALRSVLNTSLHRFNSAHKSFLRGYMSDSSSMPSKSIGGGSAAVSAAQKKQFSSTATSETDHTAEPAGSVTTDVDSRADIATHSSTRSSSFQGSDIDSIRHSIESSVMAEGRVRRASIRERSSSGSRSPAVSASELSSALQSSAASSRAVSVSSTANKPPLPLSKDAVAKMVNAPRSRTQRLQLARLLRQHSASTALPLRRIQLDGLYDNDHDGDSIEDVLKNISGLEEIGECAELKNIKLEDLTTEDKLHIAQMIEEADSADRHPQMVSTELGGETSVHQRSHVSDSTRTSETASHETEVPGMTHYTRSPHRIQTASPSPSRPLSLDDLNTEERLRQKDLADTVSLHPRSVVMRSSSPTVSSLHSRSPRRSMRSPSPRSTQTHSPQRSAESIIDTLPVVIDILPVADSDLDPVDTSALHQAKDNTLSGLASGKSSIPMDTSDVPASSTDHSAGRRSSQEAGVLHEVISISQRQDTVLSEMRDIDSELCGMYKSLIEIVARMSGLQRRRVQLQSEGEQLSQRRNNLLNDLCPNAPVSLDNGPRSSAEERQQHSSSGLSTIHTPICSASEENEQSTRRTSEMTEEESRPAASGTSTVLPCWLNAASSSSNRQAPANRSGSGQGAMPAASVDHSSDVYLSCSVTSLENSVDSVQEVGQAPGRSSVLNSRTPSGSTEDRAGQVMLSISGAADCTADREATVCSVPSVSTVSSQSAVKNSLGADSSSGIGSSVSTHSNPRNILGSPLSDSGIHQNHSVPQTSQEGEQRSSVQPAGSSRLVIHSFASPNPANTNSTQSQNASQPKSPGVSVAYLGALSSDLVQQIVRNLPLTSQLGEVNKPSMYVVKPAASVVDSSSENHLPEASIRSPHVDGPAVKSRNRTTSVQNISSDLSSGEQTVSGSIPPLKLCEDSDKGGSKPCTPRSESDAQSITSGTSLGEQIKLFSERNSFSQDTPSNLSSLPFSGTKKEDERDNDDKCMQDMANCSVVLERLDMDSITIIPDSWKTEDDETDRRKKRKTRKDRDQSLQRRHQYVTQSSSDGGEEDITPVGESHDSYTSSGGVEQMEADCDSEQEDLDSTIVESRQQLSQDDQSEEVKVVDSSQTSSSTLRALSPSRLKVNPENLKTFLANVRQNFTTSSATDSGGETAGKQVPENAAFSKDYLKIAGPCAPVVGLCVHNSLLYVGFQMIGVHSYTLKGSMSSEYPVADTQCFIITPVGSGSQHYLAVGCANHLTFLSISDQSVVSKLDTVVKVMCMVVVDTSLYAGLDSGAVVVVSLTTLQETSCFQASDCAVQCMAWTREGSTRLLTVASQDANIHVIDASSGLPIRIISAHTKSAFALCMLDHFVLSGSGDRKVMAHNVHNASFAWELHDHKGIITSISVDNGLLFTAGYDKIIHCYDLKTRKLLHLMYGAGKCIIMKMTIHNSILYTGNRDGEVEAIDLRDMGSFACECVSCSAVYGLKEHLWHHLVADHLLPNTQAMRCPWSDCSVMLDTRSAPVYGDFKAVKAINDTYHWKDKTESCPVKAGEHLRRHIDGTQQSCPDGK